MKFKANTLLRLEKINIKKNSDLIINYLLCCFVVTLIHRLDEISDEEDLDLIPPRPVEDRCQCCGAVTWQGCVIS